VKRKKNPAAVALGRLGGKARADKLSPEQKSEIGRTAGRLGGKRRAEVLTAAQRKAIAQKAAKTRWGKKLQFGGE
jgi:hypothetical protein